MKKILFSLLLLFLIRPTHSSLNTIYAASSANSSMGNTAIYSKNKLPDAKNTAFRFNMNSTVLSQKQEYQAIQGLLQSFYQNDTVADDPVVQRYLEKLVGKLAKNTELNDKNIIVLLIKNPTLNAFAFYGAIVGIYTGLIYHLDSEEQLAAVLAHELVHINQKHIDQSIADAQNISLSAIAGILGALLLKNANLAAAATSSIIGGASSHFLSFSRQHEEEADRIGIKLMHSSHINPHGMAVFLKQMKRFESQNQAPELLRTHPLTAHRLVEAESLASQYPNKDYPKSTIDFDLIKMHILFDYLPPLENPVTYLQGYIKSRAISSEAASYGMAMAYYKNNQYEQAAKALAPLLKAASDKVIYQLLYNQIIYHMGKKQEALKNMQQLTDNDPDYFPASVLYAKLLSQSKAYKESQSVLKRITAKQPQYPFIWKLLAEASSKINDSGMYFIATAHYLRLTGETDRAISQLDYVLNNKRITYSKKLMIQQFLATLLEEKG